MSRKSQEISLRSFTLHRFHGTLSNKVEPYQTSLCHHLIHNLLRNNNREDTILCQESFHTRQQVTKRKCIRMSCHRPLTIRIFQTIYKKRRIANDRVKPRELPCRKKKILQATMLNAHPTRKRTFRHIFLSLPTSSLIHINPHNFSMRKTLRHHQRNKSCARTYIEDTSATRSPSSQQHPVGTHLHGTPILSYLKLFETKTIHHTFSNGIFCILFYFSNENTHYYINFCIFPPVSQ